MFSGVSGVRAHQVKMDSVGNNIANVNTVGYKGSYVSFEEAYSQLVRGAGSPQGGRGGTNPQQIGLGVGVASMDVDHTSGSSQRTDRPTDMMINGNGFFVVTDDPNFQNKYYTRAGNFTTDRMGYLVTPGGLKVLGSDGKPLRIDMTTTKSGTTTTDVEISGNVNYDDKIDEKDNIAFSTTMDVYDTLGRVNTVVINFGQKIDGLTETSSTNPKEHDYSFRAIQFQNADIDGTSFGGTQNADGTTTAATNGMQVVDGKLGTLETVSLTNLGGATNTPANVMYAKFDANGEFLGIYTNLTLSQPAADKPVVASAGTKITTGAAGDNAKLVLKQAGSNQVVVDLFNETKSPNVNAFKNLTHFPKESNAAGKKVNGNAAGSIKKFNVSASGEIVGMFTNGESEVIGTILLADFDNNAGLQKLGSNLFKDTVNSGVPKFGIAGTNAFGKIAPGAIEMSNVDLSKQFTEMIITQRGFQANTRVITTSDEILQELVNLKR